MQENEDATPQLEGTEPSLTVPTPDLAPSAVDLTTPTTDPDSLHCSVIPGGVVVAQNGTAVLPLEPYSPVATAALDQLGTEPIKEEAWQFDLSSFAAADEGVTIDQDKANSLYHLQQ